jgi:hypothetical protein
MASVLVRSRIFIEVRYVLKDQNAGKVGGTGYKVAWYYTALQQKVKFDGCQGNAIVWEYCCSSRIL